MKRAGVTELKAHLSQYLRAVLRGEVVIVLDRNKPIARIVPIYETIAELVIRPGIGSIHDIPLPDPLNDGGGDILDDLRTERADRF